MKHNNISEERRILAAYASLAAAALAIVLGVGVAVYGDAAALDREVLLALRAPSDLASPIGPAWLTRALTDFTALGDTAVLTVIVVCVSGYLLAARKAPIAIQVASTAALGAALNTLTKMLVHRPRPDIVPHLSHFSSNSFPSGHAFNSTVVFLTLGILAARAEWRRPVRAYLLALAVLTPLTIGFTRLYLGVHWPSDVLAGWCFGALWVWISLRVASVFSDQMT